jgi:mannose-6-phosphate isomerase-like protein (cupin superfamily)
MVTSMRMLPGLLFGLAVPVALAAQAPQAPPVQPPSTQAPAPAPKPAAKPAKPATGTDAAGAATPQKAGAPRSLVMTLQVTSRAGMGLGAVKVSIDGPVTRDAQTDDGGIARFPNVKPGTYRVRFESPKSIAFEKELTLKPGQSQAFDVTLDDAPAPPPAPSTPAKASAPALGSPGDPKTMNIADFVEKNLIGREPMKRTALGCSGLLETDLLQLRDPLPERSHDTYDETLYVVAGQGTIKLAGRDTNLDPASFVVIPRGTAYSLTRRGNKPLIALSTYAGEPCAGGASAAAQK